MIPLFITFSSCEVCCKTIEGKDCLPVVEVECRGCGYTARVCPACRRRGCPICGGGMKNIWTPLTEKKVPVRQIVKGTEGKRR